MDEPEPRPNSKGFLRDAYARLPAPLRGLLFPAGWALSYAGKTRCGVWVLSGTELAGGEALTVGYCGGEEAKHYLAKKIFAGTWKEEPLGRTWRRRAFERARRADHDLGLFVWEIPRFQEKIFHPGSAAFLPGWVRMDVSLADGSPALSSAKFRTSRNLVERLRLTRHVSNDSASFNDFFSRMYFPYIAARHEGAALKLYPEDALREFKADRRELLVLKNETETLGGVVLGYTGGQARFWVMGLNLGIGEKLKNAASDALYYHMFMRAREKNHASLHLGHCRPFVSDGVMEYKRRWGGRLSDVRHAGEQWALRVVKESSPVKSFLRHNPFVAMGRGGQFHLRGYLEKMAGSSASETIAMWKERYCTPGAIDLHVYELSPRIALKEKIAA